MSKRRRKRRHDDAEGVPRLEGTWVVEGGPERPPEGEVPPPWDDGWWHGSDAMGHDLLRLTEPMESMPPPRGPYSLFERAVQMWIRAGVGEAVWNAVSEAEGNLDRVDRVCLREFVIYVYGVPRSEARKMVDVLVDRRRRLWPDDRRLVEDFRVKPDERGEPRLEARTS